MFHYPVSLGCVTMCFRQMLELQSYTDFLMRLNTQSCSDDISLKAQKIQVSKMIPFYKFDCVKAFRDCPLPEAHIA